MESEQIKLAHYVKEKLLKLRADDVIISLNKSKASQIKFVNNKIAKTGTESLVDMDIFLTKDKKITLTTLKDVSKKSADNTIRKVMQFIKHLAPKEDYFGIAQGPFKYKELKNVYDERISKLNEKAVNYVEDAINIALNNGAKRSTGVLEFDDTERLLLSSKDVEAIDKSTKAYFSIRALVRKDASGHSVCCSRTLNDLKYKEAAQEAALIAKLALNPKGIAAGRYDIIFDQIPFACLLNEVGKASSVFNVEAGLSFLKGKIGKKVANKEVTLIDDASLDGGFDSVKFDDEGVPSQKNVIIDEGTLRTYLHNTSTARKYKTKTTANAGLIVPTPTNLILQSGKYSREELLKEVKKGLYVTNIWYTRFQNYAKGDFSTVPRDGIFFIENGKIKYPVKEIRISENILNLLCNISAIGKEEKQIYGWEVSIPTLTPMVLVKNVNVTKPE